MVEIVIGCLVGGVVGAFYFLGLGWTVDRVVGARRPIRGLVVSFVLRLLVVLAASFALIQWSLVALAAAGIAFFVARRVVVGRARRSVEWS